MKRGAKRFMCEPADQPWDRPVLTAAVICVHRERRSARARRFHYSGSWVHRYHCGFTLFSFWISIFWGVYLDVSRQQGAELKSNLERANYWQGLRPTGAMFKGRRTFQRDPQPQGPGNPPASKAGYLFNKDDCNTFDVPSSRSGKTAAKTLRFTPCWVQRRTMWHR